jgi:hypothetical protein
MRTKRRTELTVETRRILVIRQRGRLPKGWCERCGKQVRMINLEDATQADLSWPAITRLVEAGGNHFTASADETTFICLNSFREQT